MDGSEYEDRWFPFGMELALCDATHTLCGLHFVMRFALCDAAHIFDEAHTL